MFTFLTGKTLLFRPPFLRLDLLFTNICRDLQVLSVNRLSLLPLLKLHFMKRIPHALALLCLLTSGLHAQTLPPFQPEQDACNALPLCGGVFTTPYSYSGYGYKLEQIVNYAGGDACFSESNSVWLKLQVATPGTIAFSITPVNTSNDYDFAVYNITGKTCDSIKLSTRVRCNGCDIFSSPGGLTGLSSTATGTVSGPGPGPAFISAINAIAGETYLVMVDNFYQGPLSGFTIDFGASTATFLGGTPPAYDTIKEACDYSQGMDIHLTKQVKCSSLQPNGSDFQLSPALATVVSAVGQNCSGPSGYTQNVTLTFSNPLPAGTYALKAKNGTDNNTLLDFCNTAQLLSDSIVFVVAPLTVDLGPDTATCINNSIQLNAQIGGGPFTTTSVQWTPATYLSNTGILNPVSTPRNDITYIVTVVPDGKTACAKKDTLKVSVLQGFFLANHDTVICKGDPVNLSAIGDVRYQYSWTPVKWLTNATSPLTTSQPDSTLTYTVTAAHAGCRDSSLSVRIEVQPSPQVAIGPDMILCYGDTLHMHPVIIPGNYPNYQYLWSPGQFFNFPNAPDPVYTATDSALITFTVTTPAGCTGKAVRFLAVIPNDFARVTADTGVCPGEAAQLHVTGGLSYIWSPDKDISSLTSADPVVRPRTTTVYSVQAENGIGCRDTQYVEVSVYPNAVVSLPDTVHLFPGESYRMDPGGNAHYFTWFPPLGLSNPNIANPMAAPDVNTRYIVTARTETGCETQDSVVVMVMYESLIDVPNAFAPGSGPNGTLKPVHRGSVRMDYFRVFNRWGQLVFESTNVDEGWDGKINGVPQPMGVYVYTVQATLPSGRVFKKQGNVMLVR